MPDFVLLIVAWIVTFLGMAWLALAMDVHWKQVRGAARPAARVVTTLRVLGCGALAASLLCCLLADTATMAVLVWMMLLAICAFLVATVLASRPRLLAPLAGWIRA